MGRVKADLISVIEDDADDIDTGTRYDPDAPISLDSCYACDPKWKAGKPVSGKYRCKRCGRDVPCTCIVASS